MLEGTSINFLLCSHPVLCQYSTPCKISLISTRVLPGGLLNSGGLAFRSTQSMYGHWEIPRTLSVRILYENRKTMYWIWLEHILQNENYIVFYMCVKCCFYPDQTWGTLELSTSDPEVSCDAPGKPLLNCHRTLGKVLTAMDSNVQTYLLMHLMEQEPCRDIWN